MTITSWEWTIYSTWAHELIPFFWCGSCCWFVSILCSIFVVLFLLAIFTAIGKSSLCFVINQEWTMVLLIYIYDQLASIWHCYIQLISVLLLRTLFLQLQWWLSIKDDTQSVRQWVHTQHCWPMEIHRHLWQISLSFVVCSRWSVMLRKPHLSLWVTLLIDMSIFIQNHKSANQLCSDAEDVTTSARIKQTLNTTLSDWICLNDHRHNLARKIIILHNAINCLTWHRYMHGFSLASMLVQCNYWTVQINLPKSHHVCRLNNRVVEHKCT